MDVNLRLLVIGVSKSLSEARDFISPSPLFCVSSNRYILARMEADRLDFWHFVHVEMTVICDYRTNARRLEELERRGI